MRKSLVALSAGAVVLAVACGPADLSASNSTCFEVIPGFPQFGYRDNYTVFVDNPDDDKDLIIDEVHLEPADAAAPGDGPYALEGATVPNGGRAGAYVYDTGNKVNGDLSVVIKSHLEGEPADYTYVVIGHPTGC